MKTSILMAAATALTLATPALAREPLSVTTDFQTTCEMAKELALLTLKGKAAGAQWSCDNYDCELVWMTKPGVTAKLMVAKNNGPRCIASWSMRRPSTATLTTARRRSGQP